VHNLKVAIFGNSVGLRNRPPEKFPNNRNYGEILEELLQSEFPDRVIVVRNLCVGRGTIWDVLARRNEILSEFPNYYITNLGVTDASTREIPLWFSNIVISRKESLFRKLVAGFYYLLIRRIRPHLVKLRMYSSWTRAGDFEKYFNKILVLLNKDTNARVINLSINPSSRRVEKELPGSHKNYRKFNSLIQKVSARNHAYYLDTNEILDQEIHVPDGIHFSSEGNKIVAQKLCQVIVEAESVEARFPNSPGSSA